MKKYFSRFKKISAFFFNTRAAAVYILLFATSIAVATFVENDFGTASAHKLIYKSLWFETLLFLFGVTIIINIFKFRMIQRRKWAVLLFHSAIIIILIGAGVTRYFGFEGIMHIRENSSSNSFLSSNTFLKFKVTRDDKTYDFDEQVSFASLGNNKWDESYLIGPDLIHVSVQRFIPNPIQALREAEEGKPTLNLVVAGSNGREDYFISLGEIKRIGELIYNFQDTIIEDAINIIYRNDSLLLKTDKVLTQMTMATQRLDTINYSHTFAQLKLRSLYSDGANTFVFSDFKKRGVVKIESESLKVKSESLTALLMNVSVNGRTKQSFIYESKGFSARSEVLHFDNLHISIAYGSKEIGLPFSLKLKEFILDKYPGTNSASSYASEVQIVDSREGYQQDHRIYMNHILNYKGYRFFQSSFDKDEKGTYLSVNNDFWGTLISYVGYALLTLGMILTFLSKKTRFYQLTQKIKGARKANTTLLLALLLVVSPSMVTAQSHEDETHLQHIAIDKDHAKKFSRLIVQDFNGRMKPIHTLSRELVRKISRKESWYGLNADQIVLSMFVSNSSWYVVDIIKLGKHEKILRDLELSGTYASYKDFFTDDGEYKLNYEVGLAYNSKPIDRGVYEKELLKLDEKINILRLMLSGDLLNIIPDTNSINNTWISNHRHSMKERSIADNFFNAYSSGLRQAVETGDYSFVNDLLDELEVYQNEKGGMIVPSSNKVDAEIFLNNSSIFSRLAAWYIFLGIGFLFFLFFSVFKPAIQLNTAHKILLSLVVIGFILHTIGLGLRWYVSGRAPWSNGYESMIYIAWTTTLSGLIFARKSFGGLAATMVLAATILLVSTLSFLDPEITPLVPVLKSYWLTIHVSMEAGSYGFLMLGAIIGLINLILMIFLKDSNRDKIRRIIKEMSYISELTLIGGLFMVSIGTYLGGVWANESWGRYWGWDAKETWALVTILVYAFILHMRIIPKLKNLFSYNLATIFGLGSVLMTYYGVNYYLSGLHSYAAGDPVPVPAWVYIVVISIMVIGSLAYFKMRKYQLGS